ncbi:MAG: hypothetical protein M1838_001813 [Thelocarpon superellum]|nr:MAG: hypothetical protein M1838_001813 [Thelocarpon superellum]
MPDVTPATHPSVRNESKSAKKKKNKQEVTATSSSMTSASGAVDAATKPVIHAESPNGTESREYESPYIQELYKSIRNINKKINATAKVDSILAEYPGKSLDELVADRKINNDQKAQALKKPALLASLTQLQEQVAQYKKFDHEYQARLQAEKDALQASHQAELDKVREESAKAAGAEVRVEARRQEREHTLLLSKFLRLAAAKRQEGDADTDDAKALEGLLLMVYGGDASAVSAAEKLIQGVPEPVLSTDHQPLDYTYAQVKEAAMNYEPYLPSTEETLGDALTSYPTPPADGAAHTLHATDPTLAHAGLSELNDSPLPVNGIHDAHEVSDIPHQSIAGADAANEIAASHWDATLSASAEGEGWVDVRVPRDPTETETGLGATPAGMNATTDFTRSIIREADGDAGRADRRESDEAASVVAVAIGAAARVEAIADGAGSVEIGVGVRAAIVAADGGLTEAVDEGETGNTRDDLTTSADEHLISNSSPMSHVKSRRAPSPSILSSFS